MTGPIAAILAAMIAAASSIGGAGYGELIEEAKRIEQEQREKEEASEYLIAIDAGHQAQGNFGQEPIGPGASQTKTKVAGGTRGTTTGVPEYELTLDISLQLRDELEERGYKVLMIRETHEVDITNSERAQMANEADADVFIRVHANGSENSSANGAMTICQTSSNPYNSALYEDSKRLSELVLDAYTEATGVRKEYVWETDTMSGINWCSVPVTIIEMGYMTNPAEDQNMQDDEFQKLMVRGMADGIEAYINEKKEEESGNNDIEEDAMSEEEQPEDSDTAATEASDTAATEDSDAAGTEIAAATEPDEDEFEFLDELDPEEEEREREKARLKEEKRAREAKEQALRDALASTDFAPARKQSGLQKKRERSLRKSAMR